MAAALRHHLIFDLDRAGAGPLEHPYRVRGIDSVAEAGIGIDHEWQVGDIADRHSVLNDLAQIDEGQVGQPERHIRHSRAGHIDRLETEIGDHAGRQWIGRAGHNDGAPLLQLLFERHDLGHFQSLRVESTTNLSADIGLSILPVKYLDTDQSICYEYRYGAQAFALLPRPRRGTQLYPRSRTSRHRAAAVLAADPGTGTRDRRPARRPHAAPRRADRGRRRPCGAGALHPFPDRRSSRCDPTGWTRPIGPRLHRLY